MIRVSKLYKRFGLFEALRYLDFEIAQGETVGLLGENGAGKTTTMRILACYFPPTSGLVEVDGHEVVFESAAVRRAIGYMPESVPLYGNMRVEEFLRFRARLRGLGGRSMREAVDRVLGVVDLTARRRQLIQNLSKGLRQRVGIADALVHDPKVLILDEPTSGLDPSQRREVRDVIRSLEGRHTVVISSHILPEIEMTCQRAVVIHEGRVAASESIRDLKRRGGVDRFQVTARATAEAMMAALAALKGIEVRPGESIGEGFAVLSLQADTAERRAEVAAALVRGGIAIHEIRGVDASLEEAFMRLIGKPEQTS